MESRSRFDNRDPRLNFYNSPRAVFGNLKHSKSDPHLKRRKHIQSIIKRRSIKISSREKTQKLPKIVTKIKGEPLPFNKSKRIGSPKSLGRLILTPPGLGYRPPFHIQTPAGTPSKYGIPSTSFYYETPKKNRPVTVTGRARWTVPTKSNMERRRYQDEELRDFWSKREAASQCSPHKRQTHFLSSTSINSSPQRPQTCSPMRGARKMLQTRLGTETTTFNFGRSPLPFERRRLIRPD